MHDPLVMRRLQSLSDLGGQLQGLVYGDRTFGYAFSERRTLHKFHDEEVRTDIEETADVVMIERRDQLRLAFESLAEALGGNLDGYVAPEPCIPRAIHFSNTACANLAG